MKATKQATGIVTAALVVALCATTRPALSQSPQAYNPPVTVSVTSAPLPALLQAVARAAGVGITVDSSVPQDVRATIHFSRTPLRTAWALVEQAYGLVVREASPGNYIASRAPSGTQGTLATPSGWDGTVVRVFRLQHASAEAVAEALAALFGSQTQSQTAQQPQQPQQPQGQAIPQAQQVAAPMPLPAPAQGQQGGGAVVAIAAVPETNQLVVRTTPHMAFILAQAVRQLDVQQAGQTASPAQPRRRNTGPVTESYTLRYAKPSAVAKVLTEQVQGLKVSADDTQNTVVVTGNPADHDRVRQILETLDRPLSQLVVEAEVFSVQDSVQKTLGIEWSLDAVYTISQAPGRLDPFQIVARLQAAANQGRARVLSRPRVLTVSGEQATITVGDQIPVLGRDQQGNTIVVQTVNAGMRLQVTPRILPDGNVELQLAAEANTLSGFIDTFPIISQRSVQTRLSIRDGTPVIIGGLIGENKSTTTVKLPFLGDLPILGALFRSTTDRAERVELVIVVTPRVVSSGPITTPSR